MLWGSSSACATLVIVRWHVSLRPPLPPILQPALAAARRYGVGCCVTAACNLTEGLPPNLQCNCTVGAVQNLTLAHSNIVGPIPTADLKGLSCSLRVISMAYNHITGTLPSDISALSHLRLLLLAQNGECVVCSSGRGCLRGCLHACLPESPPPGPAAARRGAAFLVECLSLQAMMQTCSAGHRGMWLARYWRLRCVRPVVTHHSDYERDSHGPQSPYMPRAQPCMQAPTYHQ